MVAFAPGLGVCAIAEYALPSPITLAATSRESFCIGVVPISLSEESTVKKAV